MKTRLGRAVLALGVALGLAACAPITTNLQYAPSDGIRVELSEEVVVHNLMIISAGKGKPGAVQGAISNRSTTDDTVEFGDSKIKVPANSTVTLGEAGEAVKLDEVAAAPGSTLPVNIAVLGTSGSEVPVPVLDGTLSEYSSLAPENK